MTEPEFHYSEPPPPVAASGFDLNRPTIVSLLYLASFLTGITALIGLVLAYVWRGEPHEAWEQSHFTFLIRTFWLGLLFSVLSALLTFVVVGLLGFVLIGIWLVVRAVMVLVAAQKRAPIRYPTKLLW